MNLKRIIKDAGIKQTELANRLGVTKGAINQATNREVETLTLGYLRRISQATGISLATLMGEDAEDSETTDEIANTEPQKSQELLKATEIPGVYDCDDFAIVTKNGRTYLCTDLDAVMQLLASQP